MVGGNWVLTGQTKKPYPTKPFHTAPVGLAAQIVKDNESKDCLEAVYLGKLSAFAKALKVTKVDLNRDGRLEYIVTPYEDDCFCSPRLPNRCMKAIYQKFGVKYKLLLGEENGNMLSDDVADLVPSTTSTKGYLDIIAISRFDGERTIYRYDGKRYHKQ